MGVSGPKQDLRPNTPTRRLPTPMQVPNQRNSTVLLVNVFPQIPNSQNATTERERKTKRILSNFSSLQTGCHMMPVRLTAAGHDGRSGQRPDSSHTGYFHPAPTLSTRPMARISQADANCGGRSLYHGDLHQTF
jgi:hypothetical protein